MNRFKGLVFGGGGITGQIDRIISGLEQFGLEVNNGDEDIDFIFHGNHWYKEAEPYIDNIKYSRVLKIFNVLDIPVHIKDFNYNKHKELLLKADVITCISEFVKNQIKLFYGLDAINIGYPIKDLVPATVKTPYRYLSIGRLSDPNKSCYIGQLALKHAGIPEDQIALIGPEPPPANYGHWFGSVSDQDLCNFYSSAEYLIAPSHIEGLCLPVIESICSGVIPIVFSDMTTRPELLGEIDFYNSIERGYENMSKSIKYLEANKIEKVFVKYQLNSLAKKYAVKYNKLTVAKNIIDIISKSRKIV